VNAIAGVSGVAAAFAGLHPTGSTPIDVVLVAVAVAGVTWAGATVPWWLAAGFGLLAVGLAPGLLLAAVGLVAVALACVVGAGRHNMPWARALAVLIAVQVLARSEVQWFFGASALLSCAAGTAVLLVGVQRRPRQMRRQVWKAVGIAAGIAAVALLGFVIAALEARGSLSAGNRHARAGLDALDRGDITGAVDQLRLAEQAFASADDALGAPWAQGARLVPVAAQHRNSLAILAGDAKQALTTAAEALAQVDPDTLRVVGGRIDLTAVQALEQPFGQLAQAIADLKVAVDEAQSPWLAPPLHDRIDDVADDLVTNQVRADNAVLAVRLAPEMLGSQGPRRYFVAFTTPAEARGLGGFMGNWAELTIDNGQIAMTAFGRHTDLDEAAASQDPVLVGLDEFVGHWGRFGFADDPGGAADDKVWSIVTMAPDFPTVAQVIAQLYPQSGGRPIDGVFMLDPSAVATLLSFTGPIEVEGAPGPLTADNAAEFIIRTQYDITAVDERIDLLDAIARTTVDTLLSTSLPPPAELAEAFAPLAAQGSWSAWGADAEVQELFTRVKIDGAFPDVAGPHGVAVTFDNGGGNKIDAYLQSEVDYAIDQSAPDGVARATVTIRLTNTAPAAGLPSYVIGNQKDLPPGTNRLWMSVYTALPMDTTTIDGAPSGMQTTSVFGWKVSSRFLEIPPGGSTTVVLTLEGPAPAGGDGEVVIREQRMAIAPVYTVR